MDEQIKSTLATYLIGFADDQLILGHRDSEWCGHAPILEEDIAFANIAIDEIGHARAWYEIAAELLNKDRGAFPDQQVFFRPAVLFRNVQMVSLPKGDWAFTMLRQYFYDLFEVLRLEKLKKSKHKPIAEAAAKLLNEEIYHLRHASTWLPRLGSGTEESNQRMQSALDALWPYVHQLFVPVMGEAELVSAGFVPDGAELQDEYMKRVERELKAASLTLPEEFIPIRAGRDQQNEALVDLLIELQSTARAVPEARW